LRDLIATLDRPALFRALATAAALGLSEGFGIALLVPLIALLGEPAAIAASLPSFAQGITPAGALAAFLVAVTLRIAADASLRRRAFELEATCVDTLRRHALQALLHAEWRHLAAMGNGASRALLLASVERAGDAVAILLDMFRLIVALLALGAVGLFLAPAFLLVLAPLGLLVTVAHAPARRRVAALGERLTRETDMLHTRIGAALAGVRLTKARGMESDAVREVGEGLAAIRGTQRAYLHSAVRTRAAVQIATALILAAVVLAMLETGALALPVLAALVVLVIRFVPQVATLCERARGLAHALPAFKETQAFINAAKQAREDTARPSDAGRCLEPLPFSGELRLSGVTVEGRDAPALDEVDLVIPRGSRLAVTGPTGAGKSTLADLVSGLALPDRGQVTIDGVPLIGWARCRWRLQVGYLDQNPVLLSGSVRDNLARFTPYAGEAAMRSALDRAAAGFVFDLPRGLDQPVGEEGRLLSGGERQRLTLARILLLEPDLLILDEASSALDAETEAAIARSLARLPRTLTMLIIAHRGALLELADTRLHLTCGRIGKPDPSERREAAGFTGNSAPFGDRAAKDRARTVTG
jgi:ATP-binding cassette subfamily C protein